MHRQTHELMLDHVRAIFHAVTGGELPKIDGPATLPSGEAGADLVARRFAELDTLARLLPSVAARVPPFAFSPLVDVLQLTKRKPELLIEVALPGVSEGDVRVEVAAGALVISGTRDEREGANGRIYLHAEIPRGPFRRVIALPPGISLDAMRFTVADGVLQIHLGRGAVAKA